MADLESVVLGILRFLILLENLLDLLFVHTSWIHNCLSLAVELIKLICKRLSGRFVEFPDRKRFFENPLFKVF